MRKSRVTRSVLTGSLISALALSGYAFAQETTENGNEDAVALVEDVAEEEEARQDKIVVTGSLIARDEFSSASPIQVITAEVATLEGLVDTASLIQGSSLASGSTQLNNTFQNFVTNGGLGTQTIDLRGCGDTRTLVLLNGKRPGLSGVRGSISAFDLNAIPTSIVSRIDILKDGASTIYGSDAVCGVVNIITRDSVDDLELNGTFSRPFDSGGEEYLLSAAYGFDIGDNAEFTISAEYRRAAELNTGDRDYTDCARDYVNDPNGGGRIDRLNLSATATDPLYNCSNLYHNTVFDYSRVLIGSPLPFQRLVPSPDGSTIPTDFGTFLPGYQPRPDFGTGVLPDGSLYYVDILDAPFVDSADFIPENENMSVFATADINIGDLVWDTEFLWSRRITEADGYRQFFPFVGSGANIFGASFLGYLSDPTYSNDLFTLARPVMPFPTRDKVEVDFYMLSSSLSGGYGNGDFLDGWSWKIDGTFSRGEGTYEGRSILVSQSGDWSLDGVADYTGDGVPDLVAPPTLNLLDPYFLSGAGRFELADTIGAFQTGETIYEQTTITAVTSGEAIELPAGPLGLALGIEYREFSLEDQPGDLTQSGDVWQESVAGATIGENDVIEAFAEVNVPLFKGQKFAEDMELSASARAFEYDFGGSDSIYKVGLNWQITPVLRARSSFGTSYRAPALFETFLLDETGFIAQDRIDVCVNWGQTNNPNLQANCAALGIPPTYSGGTESALITTRGGGDTLESETGETFTAGFVITPVNSSLNIAIDYYEIELENELTTLSGRQIVGGCYSAATFPNEFCNLFDRAPATATQPFAINDIVTQVRNIDSRSQRGIDLELLYERDFDFGTIVLDSSISWNLERYINVFGADFIDGIANNDFNGTIGYPSISGDTTIRLERGDWTYAWFTDFVGRQDDNRYFTVDLNEPANYYGVPGLYKSYTEAQWRHGAAVAWEGDTWEFAFGVRNLFDEHPPQVSPEVVQTSAGNSALRATSYDYLGRRFYTSISKRF